MSPAPLIPPRTADLPSLGRLPDATFPLVLTALTVAVLAMSLDAVQRYSENAFGVGTLLTLILAVITGRIVRALAGTRLRLVVTLALPTLCGALIGVAVQAVVLHDLGGRAALRDLGGAVDTTEPLAWLAAGTVLGGAPALLVAGFLVLASRAVRRIAGHDAFERFSVAFTGFAGVMASFGLFFADRFAAPPLCLAAIAAGAILAVAVGVDRARLRFLRRVYAGEERGFEIVPTERFRRDPSLAPLVEDADGAMVLVRLRGGLYRSAAAEPIAILGADERETLRPVLRRCALALTMLTAMSAFGIAAALIA